MRGKVISILLTLAVITGAVALTSHIKQPPTVIAQQGNVKPVSPPNRTELLALVNAERAKYGVAPLTEDARLDQSAQMKADDEIKYHYFGHISPHDGEHGYGYISKGIGCGWVDENITENVFVNDSSHAVNAWIASPIHHRAMIDTRYTLTGFGISGDQIVEHFCQQ